MNNKIISLEQIQSYIQKGILIHPETYYNFLCELHSESIKGNVCMTPLTRLELYNHKISKKISKRISHYIKKAA